MKLRLVLLVSWAVVMQIVTADVAIGRPCYPLSVAYSHIGVRHGAIASATPAFFTAGYSYNVDPRLAIAIAGQESNFGNEGDCAWQHNNAWGWGGGWPSCATFSSFSAGTNRVTRGLRENYLDRGLTTIEQIGSRWAPGQPEWPVGVKCFYGLGYGCSPELGGNPRKLTYGGGCCGDCNGDQAVTINEMYSILTLALGYPAACSFSRADPNEDGWIAVHDILLAVNSGLGGCASP